ncbi:MAG: hypothetical protein PHX51_03245 [Clostridia bacterium]|nr:hypothetical protein [Clostridia bacterium]
MQCKKLEDKGLTMEKSGFFKKLKGVKNIELIFLIVVVAVVALLFLGNKEETVTTDFQSYVLNQQKSLEEVIHKIDGVGRVSVLITYSCGSEQVYAYEEVTETKNGVTKTTKEMVYVSGKPVVLYELAPVVSGIIVVAEGAENALVKLTIIKAVIALIDVPVANIEVFAYGG